MKTHFSLVILLIYLHIKYRYHSHEFHDFDRSKFLITNPINDESTSKLAFSCFGAKTILENGGEDMLNEKYTDYYKGDTIPGYDVVLSLTSDQKPQKQEIPADASDEEKSKIKADNAEVKSRLFELAEKVSHHWCTFKSDFMGAPIRKALLELKEESKETYEVEIPYRSIEKYWVKKGEENVLVYFSVHFKDPTDIALAKIMCNELKEAKKITSHAITVTYHQKQEQNTELYARLGVTQSKCSVGIVSFVISPFQIKKNFDNTVYFL